MIDAANAKESPDTIEAKDAVSNLEKALEKLVKHLQSTDFELFIDLIFKQSGWQRLGVVEKHINGLAMDLTLPATGDRAFIRVKSHSTVEEFSAYLDEFNLMEGNYSHSFYAVQSPPPALQKIADDNPRLLLADRLAAMAVRTSLVDWLITNTG